MSGQKKFDVLSPTQKTNVGLGLQRDMAISKFNAPSVDKNPPASSSGFNTAQSSNILAQMIGERVTGAKKKTLPQ